MRRPTVVPLHDAVVSRSGMSVTELHLEGGLPEHRIPFEASRFTVPPGATSELDEHEVAELWTIRRGHGLIRSGSTTTEVGPSDSIVFAPWVPHQVTVLGDEPFEAFSIWWTARDAG